ncbi:type II toxin-antitoxin system death-on-curing family toxin [Candidatus Daviesbacteria bacterium]|nr:type II toxin-antitoxin system death-on-curing family toxin [Candidatus Daviesbacteria bacterium]
MLKTLFLTLEQLLAIHYDQIERYGGSHGVRDLALLESAIQRPQGSFMGADLYPTVFEKAAALIHSLLLNHPFLDANKRTAMVSGAGFLYLNGLKLKVEQKELVQAALNIESKKWDLKYIAKWLKEHSLKFSNPS